MNYILGTHDLPAKLAIGDSIFAAVRDPVTLANDAVADKVSQLSIPVEAGASYEVEAWLPFQLGATGGYKFVFGGPAQGATFIRRKTSNGIDLTVNKYVQSNSLTPSYADAMPVAGSHEIEALGLVSFTAAGEFFIGMSQFASDATPITLKAGGFFKITKIKG